MIKYNFNAVIQAWLNADPQDRDLAQGATMLLQLDSNKIRFNNIMRNPAKYADVIESELRRHYEERINRPSEEQKEAIRKEARELLEQHTSLKDGNTAKQFKAGKRADHESLPEDIRKLYERNQELRYSMQQLHLQIRTLIKSKKDCAPQDLKDLCALLKRDDEEYRRNWNDYDSYARE